MRVGSSAVTADRRLDPAAPRARPAAHEREILALERALADELAAAARTPRRTARRPAGRRCPGRGGGRCRAAPGLAACELRRAATCTSVPSAWPAPGWTTTPAGLSTTSRCSSSQTTAARGGSGSARSRLRGSSSSSSSPPASRWLFGRGAPSTSTRRRDSALRRRARADVGARRGSGRAARPRASQDVDRAATSSGRRGAGGLRRSASDERNEQDHDADDDEAVGEVERGPPAEVEEVGHVPEPDAVGEVREAAADQQAERRRQHRVPRARAREEHDHPARRRSR